jgi:hypothetical protein
MTYRALHEGRYVIVYGVETDPRRVIVVAVLHASRDIRLSTSPIISRATAGLIRPAVPSSPPP